LTKMQLILIMSQRQLPVSSRRLHPRVITDCVCIPHISRVSVATRIGFPRVSSTVVLDQFTTHSIHCRSLGGDPDAKRNLIRFFTLRTKGEAVAGVRACSLPERVRRTPAIILPAGRRCWDRAGRG
jgi:hypothetical protein